MVKLLGDIVYLTFQPSGHNKFLRHLRITFKFSYLGNTYIRCLQGNQLHARFEMSREDVNIYLIKMST